MVETLLSRNYVDIYAVALHEAGHTLGLMHLSAQRSIMYATYSQVVDGSGNYILPVLSEEDINYAQSVYGEFLLAYINLRRDDA